MRNLLKIFGGFVSYGRFTSDSYNLTRDPFGR